MLDYLMPEMDGLELARSIRARPHSGEVAIVLLTSTPADRREAGDAGVDRHLLKPPRQSDLYNAIAHAIAGDVPQQAADAPAHAPQSAVAGTERPLVLIAEDNEVNQLVATTMLHQRGLRTELARTGLEAVRMSTVRDYAAIFMDCQMPELDGYQATEQIRAAQLDDGTPIIAMTANSMPGDRERCLGAGMDDYLSKPIQPAELERVLAQWLPRDGHPPSGSSLPLDLVSEGGAWGAANVGGR